MSQNPNLNNEFRNSTDNNPLRAFSPYANHSATSPQSQQNFIQYPAPSELKGISAFQPNFSQQNNSNSEKLNKIHVANQMNSNLLHQYQPLDMRDRESVSNEGIPFDYNDAGVRLGFIRKVYILVSLMTIVTFGFVALSFFIPKFAAFQQTNWWLVIVLTVVAIALTYTMVCYRSIGRMIPLNFLILIGFNLCESYIVSCATTFYQGEAIMLAVGITIALVIALTIYALCTKSDFTSCWGIMIVLGVSLFIGSIIGLIWRNKWLQVGLAILGAITFGIYLVVDTQLVIGKNSRKYSIDDYVLASIAIYMDIVYLFLEILRIIGLAQSK